MHDVRYAWRLLAKNPGFTAITILTLAIGIGANSALFSVVDGLLLRPLPYPDSGRLMTIWAKPPKGGMANISTADFFDIRERSRSFERISGGQQAEFNVAINGTAERLTGFRVTAGFFETLGVKPALGRSFMEDDSRPGAPRVAILGHGAWQRRFGGDLRAIGRVVTVNGDPCTIAGVMPASFRFVFTPEMWFPYQLERAGASREERFLAAFGKLKPGVPEAQARSEIAGLASNIAQAYPASSKGWGMEVIGWRDWIIGPVSQYRDVLVLFGAVGCVLLIACVNLANLLLGKAAGRKRELAVRASLGAGRGRLMTQVLTESLMLALLGGAAGVILSQWLARLASAVVPFFVVDSMPEVGVDWRVLLFTLVLSLVTGLLFGIAPAWRASRVDLSGALKAGATQGGGSKRLRSVLVVAEIALSLVLLAGAGLMIRSLTAMYAVDLGFQPENLVTMRLTMPGTGYSEPDRIRAYDRLLLERVRAIPGARSAALVTFLPLEGMGIPARFRLASHPVPLVDRPRVWLYYASDGYFETFGVPLRKGRLFTSRDDASMPRVAVVNEAFVKKYFPNEEALGQRLLLQEPKPVPKEVSVIGTMSLGAEVAWEIVGVTADVKDGVRAASGSPQIYVPVMQYTQPGGVLVVRTQSDPAAMTHAVVAAIHEIDRGVPVTDVRTMQQLVSKSLSGPRMNTWIVGLFAGVALALSALGIYGVVSQAVAESTREMGIRMALGANPTDLVMSTMLRGAVMAAAGLTAGLCGSYLAARALGSVLYQVKPNDPATYIAVAALLFAVAMLATWIPARRAARVDPMLALRWE